MSFEFDNNENSWSSPQSAWNRERTSISCREVAVTKKSTSVTMIILALSTLSCLIGYGIMSENAPYDAKTLRLVSLIYRHGARTPTHTYNTDPYKNYKWPDGWGSLTKVGKLQLYELGRKFRLYYADFIPNEYFEKDLYVLSSDAPRCLMSAYTFLAGLFPPTEQQMWHPDLAWQPIPVHSLPRSMDNMIAMKKNCPKAESEYERIKKEIKFSNEYKELIEYVSKYTNQTVNDILTLEFLYSTLLIEHETGLKLPDWTKNVFPSKLEFAALTSLSLFSYNDMLKRFYGGPLLQDMLIHMQQKRDRIMKIDRKLYVYSGHDVTITSLWRTLGFNEHLHVDYGATLVLELHEESEPTEFYVKAYYWNSTKSDSPIELKLSLCGEPCTLDKFKEKTQIYMPVDWDSECQV